MSMRSEFCSVIKSLFPHREDLVLLLSDIGVYGFKEVLDKFPTRAINLGILEQSLVGTIAGLSKLDFLPVIHSIAPFLVERAYEQIKLAVGYHNANCRLISIGASYDYINLGPTHHCPADIMVLSAIPNLEIIVPSNAEDFKVLFLESLTHKAPIYFRLSDRPSSLVDNVRYGKISIRRRVHSSKEVILSVGPMKDLGEKLSINLNFSHLNCTSIFPFDYVTLREAVPQRGTVHVLEPYLEGSTFQALMAMASDYNFKFYGFKKNFVGTCMDYDDLLRKNSLTEAPLMHRILSSH